MVLMSWFLLLSRGNSLKSIWLRIFYTISKDSGQVIRLTEGLQLGMLGERMTLSYLKDNTFSYYGSAGAMAGGVLATTLVVMVNLL